MNKVIKSVLLMCVLIAVASCGDNNTDTTLAPLRDYTTQYNTEKSDIEEFMRTHYMEVVDNPGQSDDMDVTYTVIPEGGTQTSIWDQTEYPRFTRSITVTQNDVDVNYDIYFIQLRQGSGPDSKSPTNVDDVLASYRGEYIYTSSEVVNSVTTSTILGTQFEENNNPLTFFNLYNGVIRGWSEIFPQFKTGSYSENVDGTISYNNFGAGVMFIPSGLAYFRERRGTIPAYSPLIFSFKLYEIRRTDQDGDGIKSYLEDLNGDGYMLRLATGVANIDDTDGDEIPDFLDADDDGDTFLTRYEIKNLGTNVVYPFDEIPTCGAAGNGKKRYLDPSCHN